MVQVSQAHIRGCAGRPEDSGISLALVQHMAPVTPVFGVCMGHQCIGQVWGAHITRAPGGVMHGKSSMVHLSAPAHPSQPHILEARLCCLLSASPLWSCSGPQIHRALR